MAITERMSLVNRKAKEGITLKGVNIPKSEMKVLIILNELGEAIAPEIVRYEKNSISLASVYQLLKRLVEKGIVSKREQNFKLGGLPTKRVFYSINKTIEKSEISEAINLFNANANANANVLTLTQNFFHEKYC